MKNKTSQAGQDGEQRIAELVRTLREAEQELQALTGSQLDAMTDIDGKPYFLREAQEKLRQSEAAQRQLAERQMAILNALPAHIALVDSLGVIISVNEAWRRLAAANSLQLVGCGIGENYLTICEQARGDHAEEAQAVAAGLRRVLKGEVKDFALEYPCPAPNEARRFRLMITPLHEDQPAGAVIMHVNITEQRRAEEQSHRQQSMLSSAVRITGLGGWDYDLLHDRLEWSDETLRIFGATRDRFGGTRADFLAFVHPDDREAMQAMHTRSLASDGIVEMEYRILRPDGEERLLYDRGETTYGETGNPIRQTGMVLDVTERKRSEAERDRLFNLSLDLLCVAGFNGQLKQVNPAWTKCLGWTAEELTSRPMQEFILPEDREATILSRAQIQQGKPSRGFENRYRCKDGSYRWLSWNVHPSIESRQVFAVARDVTERKRTEMSLRESEERFRQLAENINEVFWITDPGKNEMLYISPAYEKIWGRSCENLYASPITWFEAIHSEDRGRIKQAALIKQIRGEYDETYRIMRPDGAVRWIRDRAFPVQNANGEVFRIVGTAEDITARKLAEERLTEQATLLDSAHGAILVKDLEDKIIYWNKGAERTYGWTADEVLGRKSGELLYKDSTKLHECVSLLLEKGEWHGEVVKLTKEGRDIMVDVRWTLVRDAQGRPKSILAINTDITEKKKLEAQFLRAQRMDSIGTLASGIAHDLNNVLAPIIMSVAMLKELARNEDDLAVLETLSGSALRGAQLVKQVLTFARGIEGQRIPVNPHHLMRDLLNVMRDTFPKSIDMHFTSARNLWTVTGDPTQMHQVFLNLCVNARDAMPGGGNLTISMENVLLDETYAAMNPDSRTGSFVMVQVADTGMGIPPELQDRIFEPFFTTKEIGKGTGLGLSTTLAIVKSHGGFINLCSEVRKGTKFKVYLPANTTESAADEVALEQTRLPRGAGELILVVDDEEAIRNIARRTLERFGYRVMLAVNGAEAVAMYAQNGSKIAAVLTDMAMPIMDGPALIMVLKALSSQVRIIGSSGLASNELVARALGAGVQHFVPKPYTAEALLTTLKKVLSGAEDSWSAK